MSLDQNIERNWFLEWHHIKVKVFPEIRKGRTMHPLRIDGFRKIFKYIKFFMWF